MARARSEPGVSLATLDMARHAAVGVTVVAPVVGLVMGLYLVLHRTKVLTETEWNGGEYYTAQAVAQHATLAVGGVVMVFGFLLGALALVVAVALHAQVAPRLLAERLAAAREIADEQR